MARNYSFSEAVEILTHHADLEACADIGKRYPLFAQMVTKVGTKAGEDFVELASYIPEHISANKVNSAIKRMLEAAEDADDEDADEEEEAPKKAKKATKEQVKKTGKAGRPKKVEEDIEDDDEEESDYDTMNNKQMYDLLGKMGKRKDCKAKFGDLSHDSMLKYLKKYGDAAAAEDDEDVEDDEEESATDYSGMKAMELYKLCKQRKIKAEAKKPAKYYIDLLKKADADADEEDADDEDWGDEEDEEEEAPKKSAKKSEKKKAGRPKKSEPEPEEDDEDDDDDEWDI